LARATRIRTPTGAGNNKMSVIRLLRREGECNLTGLRARMVAPSNFPHYALFSHTVSNLPPNDAR
jgi:hypothetical protein